MDLLEARGWVGRKVRGKVIDEIELRGGPTDRRIFLVSEGERIMNVTHLRPSDIPTDLPNTKLGGRHHGSIDKRPVVKI